MSRMVKFFYCLLIAFMAISCEYYLGINQQPDFNDTDIPEGLNIFCMMRPDSAGGTNRSFLFVQKLWPVLVWGDFYIIKDVDVVLEHYAEDALTETIGFPLQLPDENYADTLYRPAEKFHPQPGDRYKLICRHADFPDAVGEIFFPSAPRIYDLSVEGRNVSFSVEGDTLIKMLEVYLVAPGISVMLSRIATEEDLDTEISLELPADPAGMQLHVFSYDRKMAVYLGNSNTSLNFNKYRTVTTTLDSGYGVFGALNYTVTEL